MPQQFNYQPPAPGIFHQSQIDDINRQAHAHYQSQSQSQPQANANPLGTGQSARERAAAGMDSSEGKSRETIGGNEHETKQSREAKAGLIDVAMKAQAAPKRDFNEEYTDAQGVKQTRPYRRVAGLTDEQTRAMQSGAQTAEDFRLNRPSREAEREDLKRYSNPASRHTFGRGEALNSLMKSNAYLSKNPEQQLADYYNPRENLVINRINREHAKSREEQLAKARSQFSHLHRSGGASARTMQRVEKEVEDSRLNRLADLYSTNTENAMKMAEGRAGREEGNLYKNIGLQHDINRGDIEKELLAHRMLKDQDTQELNNMMKTSQFQSLMGEIQQAQTQEEVDAAWKAFGEENNYDWDQLQKAANIVAGLPIANSMSQTFSAPPIRPHFSKHTGQSALWGMGMGANMMGQQPFGQGHAEGGPVTDPLQVPDDDFTQHPIFMKAYGMARKLENSKPRGYMPHVIQSMYAGQLDNPENPELGFYRGAVKGYDNYNAQLKQGHDKEVEALNLRAKIFDTIREEQRERRKEHLERSKFDLEKKTKEASSRRLDQRLRFDMGMMGASGGGLSDMPTKKMTPAREKTILQAEEEIDTLSSLYAQADATERDLEKVNSGPVLGNVAEFPSFGLGVHAAGMAGAGAPEDISRGIANSLEYLNQRRDYGEKSGKSVRELMLRKEGKVGVSQYPSYIKEAFKKDREIYIKKFKGALKRMEFSGASPAQVEEAKSKFMENIRKIDERAHSSEERSAAPAKNSRADAEKIQMLQQAIQEEKQRRKAAA